MPPELPRIWIALLALGLIAGCDVASPTPHPGRPDALSTDGGSHRAGPHQKDEPDPSNPGGGEGAVDDDGFNPDFCGNADRDCNGLPDDQPCGELSDAWSQADAAGDVPGDARDGQGDGIGGDAAEDSEVGPDGDAAAPPSGQPGGWEGNVFVDLP